MYLFALTSREFGIDLHNEHFVGVLSLQLQQEPSQTLPFFKLNLTVS